MYREHPQTYTHTRSTRYAQGHDLHDRIPLGSQTGKIPLRRACFRSLDGHPQGHAHEPRPRPCLHRSERSDTAVLVPSPKLPGPDRTPGFFPDLPTRFLSLSLLSGQSSQLLLLPLPNPQDPPASPPAKPVVCACAFAPWVCAPRSLRGGPLVAAGSWFPALRGFIYLGLAPAWTRFTPGPQVCQ